MTMTEPIARRLTADDPRLAPWRAFLEAHARVSRRLDEDLRAEHDLSLAEYDALLNIAQAPGRRMRMRQLSDRVILSKSGVTRLIDRLVADGLVERSACLVGRSRRRSRPHRAWAVPTPPGVAHPPSRHQRALPRAARRRGRTGARGGDARHRHQCRHRRPRLAVRARWHGAHRSRLIVRLRGSPVGRDERLRLSGLVPRFYPAGLRADGFLEPLRGPPRRRRVEQHLLPVAQAGQDRSHGSPRRQRHSGSRSRPSAAARSGRCRAIRAKASPG